MESKVGTVQASESDDEERISWYLRDCWRILTLVCQPC